MSRRLTTTQALGLLRDISSDCSDVEQSDDDINDVKNIENSSNSDNDNELDSGAAVSPNNVNTEAEEENDEQIFRGKDGSCWLALAPNQAVSGRLQQQNIMRIRPSSTAYASSRIISDSPLLWLRILFNEPMLRNIQKCTIAELSELRAILTGGYLSMSWRSFLVLSFPKKLLVVKHYPSSVCRIDCGDVSCLAKLCLVTDFLRL